MSSHCHFNVVLTSKQTSMRPAIVRFFCFCWLFGDTFPTRSFASLFVPIWVRSIDRKPLAKANSILSWFSFSLFICRRFSTDSREKLRWCFVFYRRFSMMMMMGKKANKRISKQCRKSARARAGWWSLGRIQYCQCFTFFLCAILSCAVEM